MLQVPQLPEQVGVLVVVALIMLQVAQEILQAQTHHKAIMVVAELTHFSMEAAEAAVLAQ
jgi:hypothetical protein